MPYATIHGPRLTIGERVANANIGALCDVDSLPRSARNLVLLAQVAEGCTLPARLFWRDCLIAQLDALYAQDVVTLGQAVLTQEQIRHYLPR